MADNTQALMALDAESNGAIAPFVTGVNLAGLRQPMTSFLVRMREAMPWVPYGLESVASRVMDLGAFPRLRAFVPGQKRPSWLADENNYRAWRAMITGPYKAIDTAFLSQNSALAAAETDAAARNAAFWNSIAKYSGAEALENLWADLWAAVEGYRTQRQAAVTSLAIANKVLADYGAMVPPALSSETVSIAAQVNSLDARARAALVMIPGGAKEAGLGLAPLAIVGIAGGTILAATGAVWAVARELSAVQIRAADNAHALLMFRETADQDAAAKGLISQEQLEARRKQNVNDAGKIMDAQGAAAVGQGIGAAGRGIAAGIASVAAVGLGGWLLFKFLNKKTA